MEKVFANATKHLYSIHKRQPVSQDLLILVDSDDSF